MQIALWLLHTPRCNIFYLMQLGCGRNNYKNNYVGISRCVFEGMRIDRIDSSNVCGMLTNVFKHVSSRTNSKHLTVFQLQLFLHLMSMTKGSVHMNFENWPSFHLRLSHTRIEQRGNYSLVKSRSVQ